MKTRYHFDLVCPCCHKTSETTSEQCAPSPHVNCGDCLMDFTRIVEMKVVRVTTGEDFDDSDLSPAGPVS